MLHEPTAGAPRFWTAQRLFLAEGLVMVGCAFLAFLYLIAFRTSASQLPPDAAQFGLAVVRLWLLIHIAVGARQLLRRVGRGTGWMEHASTAVGIAIFITLDEPFARGAQAQWRFGRLAIILVITTTLLCLGLAILARLRSEAAAKLT